MISYNFDRFEVVILGGLAMKALVWLGWIVAVAISGYCSYVVFIVKRNKTAFKPIDHVGIATFIINTAISIITLVIATFSLSVAVDTYKDAKKGGDDQLKALELSRSAIVKAGQEQKQALEMSWLALLRQMETMKKEQKILENSFNISTEQLKIVKEQRNRELERPDVHLQLTNTDNLAVAVRNKGKKTAKDTLYQGIFWSLNRLKSEPLQQAWITAKPSEVKFIRPGSGFAPTIVKWAHGDQGRPPEKGERLFGSFTVQCPDCVEERVYWTVFDVGGNGVYREGKWDEFSLKPEDAVESASKLSSSNAVLPMGRSSFGR